MPRKSNRDTLRGFVEQAEGDMDRAVLMAGEWWLANQRTGAKAEEFFDSLEREFAVVSTPTQGIRDVVSDARTAAGPEQEAFEAILRE